MQRVAFQLRIRAGMIEAYEEAHRHVWPEMLEELCRFGIEEYSIFRRGQQLFLYMRVPDFPQTLARMAASEINARWQQAMAPMFEPVPDLRSDEEFAMMEEVFYLRGGIAAPHTRGEEAGTGRDFLNSN